jgi:hypothetical protein
MAEEEKEEKEDKQGQPGASPGRSRIRYSGGVDWRAECDTFAITPFTIVRQKQ